MANDRWRQELSCNTNLDRLATSAILDPKNSLIKESQFNGLMNYERVKTSQTGPEIRFINPAIYTESLNDEEVEEDICIPDINRNGNCTKTNDKIFVPTKSLSALSLKNDSFSNADSSDGQTGGQETYRCYSSSSVASSFLADSSRSKSEVSKPRTEKRCRIGEKTDSECRSNSQEVQRYTINGQRVIQVSATSSSNFLESTTTDEAELARRLAHDEWIRKKQQEALKRKEEEDQAEAKRKEEEEKRAREKEERERRERENFLRWTERKRKEEAEKKAAMEKELELQKRLKEIEDKATVAKTFCLRQWTKKKEEQQKAQQRKQQLKQKKIDEERKKRLAESSMAYEKWREKSKNTPKPATQGLLPHQKAKPAYVNPTPWQGIVSDDSEGSPKN